MSANTPTTRLRIRVCIQIGMVISLYLLIVLALFTSSHCCGRGSLLWIGNSIFAAILISFYPGHRTRRKGMLFLLGLIGWIALLFVVYAFACI